MNAIENIKLFQDIMSHEKNLRETAEVKFEELKKIDFQTSIQIFIDGMNFSKPEVRQLATLLLKKTYLDDKNILKYLTAENLNFLTEILKINLDFANKDWKTLQRTGEALAILYSGADLRSTFSEILNWFSSPLPSARRFSVFILENLCELNVITDEMAKNSCADFITIFKNGLTDADIQVKVSSLKAVCQFLNSLNSKDVILQYSQIAPVMIESLIEVLKIDSESGKQSLISINDLADSQGKFWKEHLDSLLVVLCEIGKETSFDNEIRETALEIVYSLAKSTPAFIRKSKVFKSTFIPLVFQLILDLDNVNNLPAWTESNEDDELDNKEMFYGSVEGIGRLCHDLGGKYMLENSFCYIEAYLADQDWIKNHGAFSVLGWMAGGCIDEFKDNIKDFLNHISLGLVKEHPRVRYAALVALSFLLEDLAPFVQNKYHANIIPALNKLISETEPNVRVKTQACRTLKVFLNGLNENEYDDDKIAKIKPYVVNIMDILPNLLEQSIISNNLILQEETLSTLSRIASILNTEFLPYYKILMPGLKKIIFFMDSQTKEKTLLKSYAIETVSFLVSSVSENPEEFMLEFKEITENLIKILANLKEEDSQVISILNAFCHISASMKKEFYPYLDGLLPILEKYLEADMDVKIEDKTLTEYIPKDDKKGKISLSLFKSSVNKNLSINTFAYQNKVMAAEVLFEICMNMSSSFAPYLERYLQMANKFLRCSLAPKIRKYSTKALYSGILACSNDEEEKKVLQIIGNNILEVFNLNIKSRLFREVKSTLKVFSDTFDVIKNKNVFQQEFLVKLFDCLKNVVVEAEEVKKMQKNNITNEEAFDENDEDVMIRDVNTVNEIIRRVMEVNGILFKLFKEDLVGLVHTNLFEVFHQSWINAIKVTKVDQEILTSICFFTDYLELGTIEVIIFFNFFL